MNRTDHPAAAARVEQHRVAMGRRLLVGGDDGGNDGVDELDLAVQNISF